MNPPPEIEPPPTPRLKVIVSAYACEPGRGSEPGTSWEWVLHLAAHHDLTVITRANQRTGIEKEIAALAGSRRVPRFVYLDAPSWFLWLKRRLPLSQVWYYALWQRLANKAVAEQARNERFDIVHHLSWATFRFHAAIWGHGLPSIWGPIAGAELCPWALLPFSHPIAFVSELIRNIATVFHVSPLSPLRRRGRKSTITLAVSPDMQHACEKLGVPAKILPTLAIYPPAAYPREYPSAERPLRLLFVGRIMYWKGVSLALCALARSGSRATLSIIGEGPFLEDARRLTSALGLESRVKFHGRLSPAATMQAYREHDLFIFPSLHDSGGNVVVEAMSHGVPVICMDRGGPGLFVKQGITGIKVADGSRETVLDDLAAAICRYDSERSLLAQHGAAGCRHVEQEFSWPRRAEQMSAIYLEAVSIHKK